MNVGRMVEILRILDEQGIKHQELAELTNELEFDIEAMAIEKLDTFSRDFDHFYQLANPDQFSLESLYERFDNDEILDCLTENGTYNTVLAYVDQRSTKAAETFVKIGLSIDNGVYTVFDRQGNKYETDKTCLGNVFEQFIGFFTPLSMNGFCDTSAHFREYYIEKTWFEKLFGQPEEKTYRSLQDGEIYPDPFTGIMKIWIGGKGYRTSIAIDAHQVVKNSWRFDREIYESGILCRL